MQQLGDLTRSWSDALTTLSVGSLAMVLVFVGQVDPDGSLSFAFGRLRSWSSFADELSQIGVFFLMLIIVGFIVAIGFFVIQFGEFIAILPEASDKGVRSRTRIEKCSGNSALMLMFANAYTSYRLMCGLGGVFTLSGAWLIFQGVLLLGAGAFAPSGQTLVVGVFILSFGLLIIMRFARYSFSSLDWILFGDLRE